MTVTQTLGLLYCQGTRDFIKLTTFWADLYRFRNPWNSLHDALEGSHHLKTAGPSLSQKNEKCYCDTLPVTWSQPGNGLRLHFFHCFEMQGILQRPPWGFRHLSRGWCRKRLASYKALECGSLPSPHPFRGQKQSFLGYSILINIWELLV